MNDIQKLEEKLSNELAKLWQEFKSLAAAIIGDSSKPNEPSLLLRIDRLEQSNKFKSKLFWLLGSGFIALAIERLKAAF